MRCGCRSTNSDHTDFTREFLALAERALANRQPFKGSFYLRTAELFMFPTDSVKRPTRERFLQVMRSIQPALLSPLRFGV